MDSQPLSAEAPSEAPNDAAAEPILLREDRGKVAVLTLNRPEARNSLSEGLLRALGAAVDEIAAAPGIHAIVLTGTLPAFCAGHDMREMTARRADPDKGRAYFNDLMRLCSSVMRKVVASPKPVVAAVRGIATAAGCQLVASCDLAVAGESSRFATPGVNIGLFCSTPMVALSRNVGRKQAMEMLLLGELIPAERALTFGLLNRVVPDGEVMAAAMEYAELIASKSPLILKIGKEAFYAQAEMPMREAYDYASRVMAENMMARDAEEGIGAFLEKREPHWQDC
jgi:enoyl-CoA hydratase/carnithine racemase